MSPASWMLTREIYRNGWYAAGFAVVSTVAVILVHARIGFGDSPSPLLMGVCIGLMGLLLSAVTPRPHHLNLPISAAHLTGVLVIHFWLTSVVLIGFTFQLGAILFDRPWDVISLAMLVTSLSWMGLGLARLLGGQSTELVGVYFAGVTGWLGGGWALQQSLLPIAMVSAAMTLVGWRALVTAVNRERRDAPTLTMLYQRWELSLSKFRRGYRCRFASPEQAVFQLDWMRLRVGVILGPLALIIGLGLVPLLVDPTLIMMPLIGTLLPAMAVMATSSFMEVDWKKNGDFRWNLPVSDETLTRSLQKDVWVTLAIIVLGFYVGLVIVVLLLIATKQFDPSAGPSRSSLPKSFPGLLGWMTAAVPIQFALGWISAMRGLETSLLGRGLTCRQIVLLSAWFLGFYATFKYVPESYEPSAWGALMVLAGIAMCMRTWTAFRWARFMGVMPSKLRSRLFAIWLAGSIVCVGLLLGFGYTNLGWHALVIGLVAMLIQPVVALPIAVHLRRHWC